MSKKAIELLEKAKQVVICHEQDTRGTCPCCKRWLRVFDQALAILKQPKCKTCGDSGRMPTFDQASGLADAEPCLDCQQPKDQPTEFTERLRKFVKMYENEVPRRAEINLLGEACEIIEQSQKAPEQPKAGDFTKECREYINLSPCMSETTCKGYAERLKEACTIIEQLQKVSEQPAAGEFTKEWRRKLENAVALFKMGKSPDDWFQGIVTGFREALTFLDTSGAEKKDLLEACRYANLFLAENIGQKTHALALIETALAKAKKEE